MEGIVIPGLPAEAASVVVLVIGYLSALLVAPLTAIWKRLGNTQGVSTVMVSAFLSLMVAIGWAIISAFSSGSVTIVGIGQALVVAIIAFLRANGSYLMTVQANAKANNAAPKKKGEDGAATPTVTVNVPPSASPSPVTPPPGIVEGQPLPAEYLGPVAGRDAPTLRVE